MCSQELAATKGLCFGDGGYAAIAAVHAGCPNCRFQPNSSHYEYIVSKSSQAGFW